jgi:hypothetical protein
MPIFEHDYHIPLEKESIIWRYIDFWKYEAMLKKESLYFYRQDKFSDPFEGSLPIKEVEYRKEQYLNLKKYSSKFNPEQAIKDDAEEHKNQKQSSYLNCWHINNNESASMWRLYVKDNEGIAIQSTCERIHEILRNVDENIGISKVRYIDYDNEVFYHETEYPIESSNFLVPLLQKRIEYKDENEFRLYYKNDFNNDIGKESIKPKGINIKIDINKLVDKIIINPNADEEVIKKVMDITKKYGYNFEICKSKLKSSPLY